MIPKNFTHAEIDELIEAGKYVFSGKPYPLKIISEEIKKLLGKVEWLNGSDLVSDLQKTTSTDSLDKTERVLNGWKQDLSEKPTQSTLPQKESLETFEKERASQEVQTIKSKEKAEKEVQDFIAKYKKGIEQRKKIQETLKEKVVYLQPKDETQKIELTTTEKDAIIALAKSAKRNPRNFVDEFSKDIIKNLPEEIKKIVPETELETSAQLVSLDLAKRLTSKSPVAPPGIFKALANPKANLNQIISSPEALDNIKAAAITWSAIGSASDVTTRTLLYPILNKNVVGYIYGTDGKEYLATSVRTENTTHTIQLENLSESFSNLLDNPILNYIKGTTTDEARGKVLGWGNNLLIIQLKNLPKDGFFSFVSKAVSSGELSQGLSLLLGTGSQYTATATSFVGRTLLTFFPEYAPLAASVLGHFGIDVGITLGSTLAPAAAGAIEAGVATTGLVATEIASGAAATIAGTAGGATIGTGGGIAAGLATGPLAPIAIPLFALLGALAIKLIGKILNWAKKHQENLKLIGLIMMCGGLVTRSIPLLVFGGLVFVPTVLKTGFSLAKIAGRTAFFFGRIGASMAITIGTPIIVAIIVFPILVAIILFIINSGAYVVPPKSSSTGVENPYIRVEKVANPKGPFENSDLPQKVEYTITIAAKKSPLTNVELEYKCEVLRKGVRPPCPDIEGSIPTSDEIGTIMPTTPYQFKYFKTYSGDSFKDSLVSGTITATADTAEKSGVSTSGSASIIIGEPDIGCYKLVESGEYLVPSQYISIFNSSMFKIVEDWPSFVAKTCPAAGGIVYIGYGGDDPYYWGWHLHQAAVDFILYEAPLNSFVRTEFIMIHELGHHIQSVNSDYYQQFLDWPGIKWPICTYTATSDPIEAFPETLGLYGSGRALNDSLDCRGVSGTFKDNYPANWEFADKIIFH